MSTYKSFISDARLDRMKKEGWTPREVWELIDSYKELKEHITQQQKRLRKVEHP